MTAGVEREGTDRARFKAIRERLAHAAPAPWKWEPDIGEKDFHGFPMRCTVRTPEWAKYGYEPEDACFIAHAPDDIAFLLDALAQVEAERDALRAAFAEFIEAVALQSELWGWPESVVGAPLDAAKAAFREARHG